MEMGINMNIDMDMDIDMGMEMDMGIHYYWTSKLDQFFTLSLARSGLVGKRTRTTDGF
jgi:hypothetical protein